MVYNVGMVTIIVTLVLVLLAVFVLLFHGALIFGYERGGIWGFLKMVAAVIFHEIMIIFFH